MGTKKVTGIADGIVADCSDAELLQVWYALAGRIAGHKFAQLVPATIEDDGETYEGLRCPHCESEASGYDGVTVVDWSIRHTYSDEANMETRELCVDYDGTEDYEALHYACGSCGAPVSLPDGWTEQS